MSNVKIDIVSQFKGKAEFDKAGRSVSALDKTVQKLGRTFLSLYAANKVVQFGKAAASAFIEDQKSAALLANTVKNLGLAFAAPEIDAYIEKLSRASGVLDDQLRPAMQGLLTTTGSITKSQELLAQAIDISRASGVSLEQVSMDLSQAYVGNVKGLRKYQLGLTQTELKAMSFLDVQKKLNDQFGGASQAYLKSYAGQIDVLKVAASEAQETIGKGILDGLQILGTDGVSSINAAANAMDSLAQSISDVIAGQAVVLKNISNLPGSGVVKNIGKGIAFWFKSIFGIEELQQLGKNAKKNLPSNKATTPTTAQARAAALAKSEAAAAKRAKELAAAQTKQTKALKEQALLKKQSALFDMQQIQLVAALKGKLSDEDRTRVLLQLALLQGNEEEAARLSKKVADTIDATGQLAKLLTQLPDANNPFQGWDVWLKNFSNDLKRTIDMAASVGAGVITDASGFAGILPDYNSQGYGVSGGFSPVVAAAMAGNVTDASGFAGVIKVVIDGKEIASSLQNQSLSGNNTTVSRTSGNFNYL